MAVAAVVVRVRVDPPEAPGDKVTVVMLRDAVRRAGVIAERETMPVKP